MGVVRADWNGRVLREPRVTVVVVATPEDEGPDGTLMHAVHSIEQQTYDRDLVDVHIVRNTDDSPIATMQRFGVQHADTELVAFIDVDQEWHPNTLTRLVQELGTSDAFGGTGLPGYGFIFRRNAYLKDHR